MNSFYIILGLVAWVILAFWPASIAKRKGYSFALFFIVAIFFSWLIALIIAAMLHNKNETAADRKADQAAERALEAEEG